MKLNMLPYCKFLYATCTWQLMSHKNIQSKSKLLNQKVALYPLQNLILHITTFHSPSFVLPLDYAQPIM